MPIAAVDEDREPTPSEDDVSPAPDTLKGSQVYSVAQPPLVQLPT